MIRAFLIAAVTADGFIAPESGGISTAWTSKEDRAFFVARTKAAGVMVMGEKTFQTIGRALPGRTTIVYSHKDDLGVPDVEATKLPPAELLAELERRGFEEVAICGGASIYTMFLQAKVIDTIYLTVEPKLFGSGVRLTNEPIEANLALVSHTNLSESVVLLEYKITY